MVHGEFNGWMDIVQFTEKEVKIFNGTSEDHEEYHQGSVSKISKGTLHHQILMPILVSYCQFF